MYTVSQSIECLIARYLCSSSKIGLYANVQHVWHLSHNGNKFILNFNWRRIDSVLVVLSDLYRFQLNSENIEEEFTDFYLSIQSLWVTLNPLQAFLSLINRWNFIFINKTNLVVLILFYFNWCRKFQNTGRQ